MLRFYPSQRQDGSFENLTLQNYIWLRNRQEILYRMYFLAPAYFRAAKLHL